ncbi:tRNA 2-thiouridine(34) synthase MnmA [Patescibacteria group bacterium]|nr:tRNA 2-thiouridine(34) synthase MnmA [Patescibacteria group bacterium]
MNVRGKKIYVGLSGGVDSAVSAALLKRAGALVTGVFIKGWYPPGMPCTWAADRRDAMRVAARLHIPFHTLDASAEYKKSVIDYLLAEYRAGRTPNPDVMCNKEIKFGVFYRYALRAGAEYIATGHYAQTANSELAAKKSSDLFAPGSARLLSLPRQHLNSPLMRGIDTEKDQSYFLWAVPRVVLARTLFPVGNMEKSRVRSLARKFGIPVAQKKDSQGVCFIGDVSVDEFLRSEFGEAPGRAYDEKGRLVGQHDSALLYTIGERVALRGASGGGGPWFVYKKDIAKNELSVRKTRLLNPAGAFLEISFTDSNWLHEPVGVLKAQCRYRGERISGRVEKGRFISAAPFLEQPVPGQSIVFYRNDELIGGGIISA